MKSAIKYEKSVIILGTVEINLSSKIQNIRKSGDQLKYLNNFLKHLVLFTGRCAVAMDFFKFSGPVFGLHGKQSTHRPTVTRCRRASPATRKCPMATAHLPVKRTECFKKLFRYYFNWSPDFLMFWWYHYIIMLWQFL